MTNYLDIRTLSLASGIIYLFLSISMIYISANQKTFKGFNQWTVASLFNFSGLVLISSRNTLPDFFTIVMANGLMFSFIALITSGLVSFVGRKPRIRLYMADSTSKCTTKSLTEDRMRGLVVETFSGAII